MKVADVINRDVTVIDPEATLETAQEKMNALDIGELPVCESGKVIGIISDTEIARRKEQGTNLSSTSVRDAMNAQVPFCSEDQPLGEVAEIMHTHNIACLPIVNAHNELVGIVTRSDLPGYG